ncbi:MAG TPA: putative sulfate exporter family transporter [Candidatus Eremiobacteraceae bacterium]|nr:putative sulfate exporter family transporter [Candidatus Eremiobacteraceae bacterium]
MTTLRALAPGVFFAVALAIVAILLGLKWPLVGAPIFAIACGIAARHLLGARPPLEPGTRFASRQLLQAGIVMLGFGIDLAVLWRAGSASMPVLLGSLVAGLAGGLLLGRFMRIDFNLRLLVAAGTSVCGASAIAALAPVIGAEAGEVAFATATIFLYNIVAVFLFPAVGHSLHLSDATFGTWAGTAINDTSSVLAAGYAYAPVAGQVATIVKLARSLAILPIAAGAALYVSQRSSGKRGRFDFVSAVPWFILLFVAAAAMASAGIVPAPILGGLATAGRYIMIVAFAGVGFGSDFDKLRSVGISPLVLGALVWALVALTSLAIQGDL